MYNPLHRNFPGDQHTLSKSIFYRLFQLIGFLLGARFFVALLLVFALYVSAFYLFNQDESFRNFVFDYKVHGIIFCTVLSIFAGGIINQFYDFEKDHLAKPFRTRLQRFIKQKYFLYAYLGLTTISLIIAVIISYRVMVFFIVYQFFMWFYSHKLSRIFVLNNLTFVSLTIYPFFGMLVYYQTFSEKIIWLAAYLFFILLSIDVIKDTLTWKIDKTFGYFTIPNSVSQRAAKNIIVFILMVNIIVCAVLLLRTEIGGLMFYYIFAGIAVFLSCIYLIIKYTHRSKFAALNILRLWVFAGIIAMFISGYQGNL